jgi:DNA-3-methyladenine glycosylase
VTLPQQANLPQQRKLPGRLLPRTFFETRPDWVAPRLLGKLLVHMGADGTASAPMIGRIVEVEAYLGPHNDPPDPAAHAHRGPTPRNLVLFGLPGHVYVYSIYGKYFCLNISCEGEGQAGCVLLRAVEPIAGIDRMAENRGLPANMDRTTTFLRQLTSGPSRLCQALAVVRTSHNGLDVTTTASPLQVRDDRFVVPQAMVTPRIGINPANPALDWPLRFTIPGSPCVSGPENLKGKRVRIP